RNKQKQAVQQQFTQQFLQRTEEERGRIARDLHDGLSQELLLLKNEAKSGLTILPEKIDGLIEEVRTVSRALHPVMLDQIGLKQSMLHVCERIMDGEKLFITADIDYSNTLTKEKELQLFRIFQEALNNTLKYASAMAAKVQVYEDGTMLTTTIKDNGKGFHVQDALKNKAFG